MSSRPAVTAPQSRGRQSYTTVFFLLFSAWSVLADGSPVANPAAVVIEDSARFTVLTPRLVRMETAASGAAFEDRASLTFVHRHLPVPAFKVTRSQQWLVIETEALGIRYRRGSGKFNADTLSVILDLNGKPVEWQPGLSNRGNLLGTTRTVDGFAGDVRLADGASLHLEKGVLSRDGWSVVDDSANLLFSDEALPWVQPRKTGSRQDWYFFGYGHDYKAALRDFVKVAGKIPLPPRYALGYWWSRYWVYSDAGLRELVGTFRQYRIPLDVLVMDMDWHETHGLNLITPKTTPFGGMLGWTGYTWNRSLFPEPQKFLDWTESERLKVALNLHPADGVAPFESGYAAMRRELEGAAHPSGWIEYRLSDRNWAASFLRNMIHPHEQLGVDFWWLDWQQWQESKFVPGLNNTFWLNHVFFTDMQRRHPQRRPLLFHRWGGLGNHRYPVGFSGDAVISWESLKYQPYFTATAANVGYGYWSHDIGGHIVDEKALAKDGELYLRWLQFGALSPILRTHASKNAVAERRIWQYSRHFAAMRDAITLRYRLAPYLYTAARTAHDDGVSMIRPMYYDYPEAAIAYRVPQQYMLGDDLLVAPVTEPVDKRSRLATQKIWLPPGSWYEWSSGTLLAGDREINRTFSQREIPIYVKAGTILPMVAGIANLQEVPNKLVLRVFPGEVRETLYYEDAGDSESYLEGEFAWTKIKAKRSGHCLTVTVSPRVGRYAAMPTKRAVVLELPSVLPIRSAAMNGQAAGNEALTYDAATLLQRIDTGLRPPGDELSIDVCFQSTEAQDERLLRSKPGQFARLRVLGDRLKALSAREDWAATLPNTILKLIATPTRIRYQPERARHHLRRFNRTLPSLRAELEKIPQLTEDEAAALADYLQFDATLTQASVNGPLQAVKSE